MAGNQDLDGIPLPVFGAVSLALAMVIVVFGTLYWLMQPTVNPDPGMAAYHPPPGTILEPAPRKADGKELTAVAEPAPEITASVPATLDLPKEDMAKGKRAPGIKKGQATIRPRPRNERKPIYSYAQEAHTSARRPGAWPWF
jgi:hypothetical protein